MLKGFWKLTWVETKVFVREPMGLFGALILPVLIFLVVGGMLGSGAADVPTVEPPPFNVPILVALVIAVNAVISPSIWMAPGLPMQLWLRGALPPR